MALERKGRSMPGGRREGPRRCVGGRARQKGCTRWREGAPQVEGREGGADGSWEQWTAAVARAKLYKGQG